MPLATAHRNLFVITARTAASRGATIDAETRYKQALEHCRKQCGRKSAAYGLLLMELSAFYENQRRHEDADQCWDEARKILVSNYCSNKKKKA